MQNSSSAPPLQGRSSRRKGERLIESFLALSSYLSIFTTIVIIVILFTESYGFFQDVSFIEFISGTNWAPLLKPQRFGVLPLIGGTLLSSIIACLIAIPFGLLTAVYLSQYASRTIRVIVKPLLEVLFGIPTVVYGYFALILVTPFLKRFIPELNIFNALSAGLVMGIMIIPVVSSLCEDAMSSVPTYIREGAYALGASRLETTIKVVIPAAVSGIIASFILAISRAVGETMIVAMAAGATPKLTINPLESVQTITGYIVQVSLGDTPFGSIEYKTIFAGGLVLFLMTLLLNIIGKTLVKWKRTPY